MIKGDPSELAVNPNITADLSHVCEFVSGPAPWKGHKTSAIWNYFCHLDLEVHPDMKTWRLCMVCRRRGVDKAINVTESSSTGKLIDHLKRMHHDEYLQFQREKEDKLKERAANKEAIGGPAAAFSDSKMSSAKKPKKSKDQSLEVGTMPIIQLSSSKIKSAKNTDQNLQEELLRLMEIQQMAEVRLDTISDKLEKQRGKMSPFDVAFLQDRKESAVKNVQWIGKKVDALCDRLNTEAYV